MTYTTMRRTLALQHSRALRGYARWGIAPTRSTPLDHWDEWQRKQHCNVTTKRAAA